MTEYEMCRNANRSTVYRNDSYKTIEPKAFVNIKVKLITYK